MNKLCPQLINMHELTLLCPQHRLEALSEALEALQALSISVEDADAQTDAEQALFGEPGLELAQEGWLRSRVSALYESELAATRAQAELAARDLLSDCTVLGVTEVPEQDWVRATQSQFAPVQITPEFWIVPTWHAPPAAARVVIRLDPGLAFGTGTHATTRMCLRWVATHTLARVLDYGCGSGILAIAAAMHGASKVDAVDIDDSAVAATRLNAQANQVSVQVGLPALASGVYQTVLANILATPLRVLAPLLCAHVASGGALVLAGILERQAGELQAAYAPYCELEITDREEGWVLMTARC